ncbi:hypothetical protein J1614_003474 [Plenodomus biglobosus]|nr:hypothetical protein J1614_003474 [Plenodomus biglobosus]
MTQPTGAIGAGPGAHTPVEKSGARHASPVVVPGASEREAADKEGKKDTVHPDQNAEAAKEQGWICHCGFYNEGECAGDSVCKRCEETALASDSSVAVESVGILLTEAPQDGRSRGFVCGVKTCGYHQGGVATSNTKCAKCEGVVGDVPEARHKNTVAAVKVEKAEKVATEEDQQPTDAGGGKNQQPTDAGGSKNQQPTDAGGSKDK